MKQVCRATQGMVATLALLAHGPLWGGDLVNLQRLIVFSDQVAKIPLDTGGVVTGRATTKFDLDGSGQGDGYNPFPYAASVNRDGLSVDGFDEARQWFSLDRSIVIGGVLVQPGDAFRLDGSGVPQIIFSAASAGNSQLNIDAVSQDPATGDLIFSVDGVGFLDGLFVYPTDLLRYNGSTVNIFFDGYGLWSSNPGLNIDAAHVLDNNRVLVSIDIDAYLPAGGSNINVHDDDILLLYSGTFFRILSMRNANESWIQADVDALWAEEAVAGGEIRLLSSFHEVQESAGTLTLQVERTSASGGNVSLQVDTVSGTATEGSDFTGDQVLNNLWVDGEAGVKTFTIQILNDILEESMEQFTVNISVVSGTATLASPSQAMIRIIDDDGDHVFADSFES